VLQKIDFLLAFTFLSGGSPEDNTYKKAYYENGTLKSEGWVRFTIKTGYWKYYHNNGRMDSQGRYEYDKKEKYWYFYDQNRVRTQEGHFRTNKKVNWWLFYEKQGRVNHKCQLDKNIKNGYCFKYSENKLASAEKFENGKKIKEWSSFGDFEKNNTDTDLK